MTARLLPPAEWSRLAGTPLGEVWQTLPTTGLNVMVVEDAAGQIVGHWTAFQCPHAEQVWVHPDHRKRGVVVRHLLRLMRHTLDAIGATAFVTNAEHADVVQLLSTLGATRLPGVNYSVPVRRKD